MIHKQKPKNLSLIYGKMIFCSDRSGDECEEIKLHCKTILLNGLLDRDSSLQQEMFKYGILGLCSYEV